MTIEIKCLKLKKKQPYTNNASFFIFIMGLGYWHLEMSE